MELQNIYLLAGVMVVFGLALVELVKTVFPDFPSKFLPLASVGIGLFVGIMLFPFSDSSFYTTLIGGLVSGLVASGMFDLSKVIKK